MALRNLGGRVSATVDDVRDRAAEHLASEDTPEARELDRVRGRIDEVEARLGDAFTGFADEQRAQFKALDKRARKTTFPRRLFWLVVGAAAGAAALYASEQRSP